MKILFGGIPLGCGNIGDEAVLANSVNCFRRCFPECRISVCTNNLETGKRLDAGLYPLYGFTDNPNYEEFESIVREFDLFVWAGANGLSDYPDNSIRLLHAARNANVPSVLWGTGMDTRLNPAFFEAAGRRKRLFTVMKKCTCGMIDFVRFYENFISSRMRSRIVRELNHCLFTAVCAPETAMELKRHGCQNVFVSADSVICQKNVKQDLVLRTPGVRKIGLCIASQKELKRQEELISVLNRFLSEAPTELVFIPMNPQTDSVILERIQNKLNAPEKVILLRGVTDPGVVQSVAEQCDVIISSRLRLLALAANVNTPIVGISRGSTTDNFLANFGRTCAGTVWNCDYSMLYRQTAELLSPAGNKKFRDFSARVHTALLARLTSAEERMKRVYAKHAKKEEHA